MLPKKIKIGTLTFRVKRTPDDENAEDGVLGIFFFEEQYIWVKSGLSDELTRMVFLHELIHAIAAANGADISEPDVTALASGLAQTVEIKR